MNVEVLLQQPESKTLEFKRDLSSLQPILKTIVAFANTAGGTLIIGRAQDGSVPGVDHPFVGEERLANSIAENILPAVFPDIQITSFEGKSLLILEVPHLAGPCYLKQEGLAKGIYVRLGSTSRPAPPNFVEEMQRSRQLLSFDQTPVGEVKWDALDLAGAKPLFEKLGKPLNKQKLKSMEVLVALGESWVSSIGGLIVFGKPEERERWVPYAKIKLARFQGKSRSEFLDQMEASMLDLVGILNFIKRNTRQKAEIAIPHRRDLFEYPIVALRETIINAFAHADYSLQMGSIQISIFSDRLEVESPGMLPIGMTLDDLRQGRSRVRNRVIVRILRELGYMEEFGTGYKRITEECERGGYPEPVWEESSTSVRVTFYPHPKTQLLGEKSTALTPHQEEILDHLKEPRSSKKLMDLMKVNVSPRAFRYELAQLKKMGLITTLGRGPSTIWARRRF